MTTEVAPQQASTLKSLFQKFKKKVAVSLGRARVKKDKAMASTSKQDWLTDYPCCYTIDPTTMNVSNTQAYTAGSQQITKFNVMTMWEGLTPAVTAGDVMSRTRTASQSSDATIVVTRQSFLQPSQEVSKSHRPSVSSSTSKFVSLISRGSSISKAIFKMSGMDLKNSLATSSQDVTVIESTANGHLVNSAQSLPPVYTPQVIKCDMGTQTAPLEQIMLPMVQSESIADNTASLPPHVIPALRKAIYELDNLKSLPMVNDRDQLEYQMNTQSGTTDIKVYYASLFAYHIWTERVYLQDLYESFQGPLKVTSAGKSGCHLLWTSDKKFIAKSVTALELKTIKQVLPDYLQYVDNNLGSLLVEYVALIKIAHQDEIFPRHYIVMKNALGSPSEQSYDMVFDLKGSSVGRFKKPDETVYKDQDFLSMGLQLTLPLQNNNKVEWRLQLMKDVEFLQEHNLTDYSFLCGYSEMSGYFNGKIIDIFSSYNVKKRGERVIYGTIKGSGISCASPSAYAKRFVKFLTKQGIWYRTL
ncbi:hypothetical protein MP228_005677 [Amoeboaphelidium protococcarum]|nr:hypothetical protein MP228_005677 [Amoeboaphelidium protococcarum]